MQSSSLFRQFGRSEKSGAKEERINCQANRSQETSTAKTVLLGTNKAEPVDQSGFHLIRPDTEIIHRERETSVKPLLTPRVKANFAKTFDGPVDGNVKKTGLD